MSNAFQVSYTCKIGTGWQKKEVCTCKTGYKKSPYTGQCLIRGNACMQAVWRVVLPVHTEDRNITAINANVVMRPAVCIITAYVSS